MVISFPVEQLQVIREESGDRRTESGEKNLLGERSVFITNYLDMVLHQEKYEKPKQEVEKMTFFFILSLV